MNNDSVKIFRSALGGFHRDDVTNYIRETDRKHAEETADLTARLEEAERQNAELSAQAEDAASEIEELRRQLAETEERLNTALRENEQSERTFTELKESLGTAEAHLRETAESAEQAKQNYECRLTEAAESLKQMSGDNARLAAENETLTGANAALESSVKELTEKLSAAEAVIAAQPEEPVYDPNDHTSPAYKLEMYDKISAQLGDILINANRNADEILTEARAEADKIRLETEIECQQKRADCDNEIEQLRSETAEEAAYIRERLSENAADMLTAVSTDLHGNIEHCIREMNDAITDMQYEMQTLLCRITARSGEMNDRIGYYQSSVSDEIEKKLSDMDTRYGLQPGKS